MRRIKRVPKTKSTREVQVVNVDKSLEENVEVTKMPSRSLESVVEELGAVKQHIKELQAREKELRNSLETLLLAEGVVDNKGSIKLVVGSKVAQRLAKKSIKVNPKKAEEYLEGKGLWSEMSTATRVLDETKLEKAVETGVISVEDLESITDIKVTYAISLADYKPEEIPQVEVTELEKE